MPASTVSLTVAAAAATPAGTVVTEQNSTVSPGNNFENDGATLLYARNTTAGSLNIAFEADKYGVERTVAQVAIAAGAKVILGPFPPSDFNDHTGTEAASTGKVFVRQLSGSNGDLVFAPMKLNRSLVR